MERIWTIGELLTWVGGYLKEKNMEEPRLEAEVLLAFCLQIPRISLYTNYDQPAGYEERELLKSVLRRRVQGEPLAYIVGQKEFMSLSFRVNPAVLIPRPETETLVERAVDIVRERNFVRLADVGTGSGAIALSLAHYLPMVTVWGLDVSGEALEVAADNARNLGLTDRVVLRQNDLLAGIDERFELITANLPYVPLDDRETLPATVREFEPALALFGGRDGFDLYRRLIPQARELLIPGGCLLIEIDPRQEQLARDEMTLFSEVKMLRDLAGRVRVVEAWKE